MTTTDESALSLSLDVQVRSRLYAAAARKGVRVDRYCLEAIESELAKDELQQQVSPPERRLSITELIALQREEFGDRTFSQDSVELIREAREIRAAQMEDW